jgi:hypothetical protein
LHNNETCDAKNIPARDVGEATPNLITDTDDRGVGQDGSDRPDRPHS